MTQFGFAWDLTLQAVEVCSGFGDDPGLLLCAVDAAREWLAATFDVSSAALDDISLLRRLS